MEEMLLSSFDFKVIKRKIQDIINHSIEVPYELEFLLTAIPPTTESNLIKVILQTIWAQYRRNKTLCFNWKVTSKNN